VSTDNALIDWHLRQTVGQSMGGYGTRDRFGKVARAGGTTAPASRTKQRLPDVEKSLEGG